MSCSLTVGGMGYRRPRTVGTKAEAEGDGDVVDWKK